MMTFTVDVTNEEATAALMADLGLLIGAGDVITLSGDLGAGKTAAARALIRYLADDAALEVPSPTFTLVQRYDLSAFAVLHADLYRLSNAGDLGELDVLPPPDGAAVLIEWAERAGIAAAQPPRYCVCICRWRSVAALRHCDRFRPRNRDCRTARIAARLPRPIGFAGRAAYAHGGRCIQPFLRAADARGKKPHPDEFAEAARRPAGLSRPVLQRDRASRRRCRAFLWAIANGLRSRGFSAPEILHTDLDRGFLVTEDFGRAGILDAGGRPIAERYGVCADTLAALHALNLPDELPVTAERNYRFPDFDIEAMLAEVGLMPEWYLPDRGIAVSPAMRKEFDALWRELLEPRPFYAKSGLSGIIIHLT